MCNIFQSVARPILDIFFLNLPVLFPSCHALLINRSLHLSLGWKDDLMVDYNCLNDLVNVCLAGDRILVIWYGHQRWAKADSQVIRVHHVLVAVLGKTWRDRSIKYHNINVAPFNFSCVETY